MYATRWNLTEKIRRKVPAEMENRIDFISQSGIYNMDCLDCMKQMPDQSVDLVIADPPYFHVHGDFDFTFDSEADYLNWTAEWVRESHRVLKKTGAFYCWGICLMIDKISVKILDQFDWTKRNLIIWNYKTGRPSKKAFRMETEFLWFYSKEDHVIRNDAVRIPYARGCGYTTDRRKNPLGKSLGNVWEAPRIMRNYPEWVDHPTQKPLSICEKIVKASSDKGDLVYIPFSGSGSEALCCHINDRRYIASEIDSGYCLLAEQRIRDYERTGRPVLINKMEKGEVKYESDANYGKTVSD